MAVNLKDIISSLKPFAGKRMGLDFGKRTLEESIDHIYKIDGLEGVVVEKGQQWGYLYYFVDKSEEELTIDEPYWEDVDKVIGFSLDKEGNAFRAGSYDDWQSELLKLIDEDTERKRLERISERANDKGISSLNAVIETVMNIGGHLEDAKKITEATTLGELDLKAIDAIEFAAAFNQMWSDSAFQGCAFSTPACNRLAKMFEDSGTTVNQITQYIESLFVNDDSLKKMMMFCDSGDDCPHFDIADFARNDSDIEVFRRTSQQCYFCKHRNNGCNGEPCDSSIGECTYEWKDPNGDKQQTFWEET